MPLAATGKIDERRLRAESGRDSPPWHLSNRPADANRKLHDRRY
jgi:hypothetical protein